MSSNANKYVTVDKQDGIIEITKNFRNFDISVFKLLQFVQHTKSFENIIFGGPCEAKRCVFLHLLIQHLDMYRDVIIIDDNRRVNSGILKIKL